MQVNNVIKSLEQTALIRVCNEKGAYLSLFSFFPSIQTFLNLLILKIKSELGKGWGISLMKN